MALDPAGLATGSPSQSLPTHRGPLSRHAGILRFYGRQARLIWEWRATRLSLVRRSLLTLLGSVLALKIITFVSADLVIDGIGPLLEAAVFLTILDSLARPILIWLLSPFPGLAVQIVGLIFQVVVVAGLGRFVPGVHVGGGLAPLRDAILLTVLNAIFAEVMRTSDDRSIFSNQVRRLAAGGPKGPVSAGPGMLVVQIDGLSLPGAAHRDAGRSHAVPGQPVPRSDPDPDPLASSVAARDACQPGRHPPRQQR